MTAANILIYLALIGYILYRRAQGHPVKEGRRLFVLPLVLVIIGFLDVTQGSRIKPVEITLIVIAAAVSLGLGAFRGRADKLSERDGSPYVQWGAASLALFVINIAIKLGLDIVGVAAGSSSSAVGKSLLLTFGLTLLGEAVVIRLRTTGTAGLLGPDVGRAASPRPYRAAPPRPDLLAQSAAPPAPPASRPATGQPARTSDPRVEPPSLGTPTAGGLIDAVQSHHQRHRERHHRDHNHGGRHDRGES